MYPTLFDEFIGRADSVVPVSLRANRYGVKALAVVFGTLLTTAAAQISVPVPFTPVPFTFQPMVVLLCAAAFGARLGVASQILYLFLGVIGMPVFAASGVLPPGLARLAGPTGGYLMAYPVAALVTGWLAERGLDRRYVTSIFAMTCGLGVVFIGGVSWLAFFVQSPRGLSIALATGLYPFILADLLKLCVAAGVMPALWDLTGLRRPPARTRAET